MRSFIKSKCYNDNKYKRKQCLSWRKGIAQYNNPFSFFKYSNRVNIRVNIVNIINICILQMRWCLKCQQYGNNLVIIIKYHQENNFKIVLIIVVSIINLINENVMRKNRSI